MPSGKPGHDADTREELKQAAQIATEVALRAEVERLRGIILDMCDVFDEYSLPDQSYYYWYQVEGR